MSMTSSAIPFKLYQYADVTTRLDNEQMSEAGRLGATLRNFEARCTEYAVHVSYLADRLRDHAGRAEGVDRWVRTVGLGFEMADRGSPPVWKLGGQSISITRTGNTATGLGFFAAQEQYWSFYLQLLNTKLALNEALLRMNYLIYSLRVAPWLEWISLLGALWEKYRPLLAGGLIASSIRLGHAYPGEIIIDLPNVLKNVGFSLREIRSWAGLSEHLTHIKYTNLPKHIFWVSLAMSVPVLVAKWHQDISDYGTGKYTGPQLASALTADTLLTLTPAVTSYAGSIAGMKIGAVIGTAIAPGPGTVIGGAIGAIAGGIITGMATDAVIERTDAREKSITWLDENIFGPLARKIATAVGTIEGWVDEASQRLHQEFQDIRDAAAWIKTDGVRQFDKTTQDSIENFLPPDIKDEEEFVGLKGEGSISFTVEGIPAYVEGGGEGKITRDKDGKYVVTLNGMGGVGVGGDIGGTDAGAKAGVRGQVETEFTFDPQKQGDMTAMARLLADTGASLSSAGLGVAGIPVQFIEFTASSAALATAGQQVDYRDNMTRFQIGMGTHFEAKVGEPEELVGISTEANNIVATGFGQGEAGQIRPYVVTHQDVEAKGGVALTSGSITVDVEHRVLGNPPGVESTYQIEPKAGVTTEQFQAALKEIGEPLPIGWDVSGSAAIEIKINSDWDIDAINAAIRTPDGGYDFSALAGMGAVEISRIVRVDASLDADLVIVEFEGSAYMGRKEVLYQVGWGESLRESADSGGKVGG